MEIQFSSIIGAAHFFSIGKNLVLTPGKGFLSGHVIDAEHDILTRHYNGLAMSRTQNVIGAHHQHPRLDLRFDGKRYVHRHLVAVEVSIEGSTNQWMDLNSLPFDENGFECLKA